jgi:hypothetical protein
LLRALQELGTLLAVDPVKAEELAVLPDMLHPNPHRKLLLALLLAGSGHAA